MNLFDRMLRTQKTVDAFKGKVFKDGTADCVQLVRAHAKHMGRPFAVPKYRDVKGAAAAMKAMGYRTLSEALDDKFTRIDSSAALMGDIIEGPGSNGFSSLGIAVGGGRVIAFHEETPFADIVQPLLISGAWRIDPSGKSSRTGQDAGTPRTAGAEQEETEPRQSQQRTGKPRKGQRPSRSASAQRKPRDRKSRRTG